MIQRTTPNWLWDGETWTLPMGAQIRHLTKVGRKLPVNLHVGAYYNALRVAALPHHCRPQGVPRPPCPVPGDRTRGKAPASGRRAPRAAGARAMAHTPIETPRRNRCQMSAEQRTKLSLAQRAYVTHDPRWPEHRRKLAAPRRPGA